MTFDLVVKNGLVISAQHTMRADVAVRGEKIAALGSDLHGAREIDASGLYVLPGAIDGHVHLADDTYPPHAIITADTFATGSRAAAIGGTTCLIDFAQPRAGQSLIDVLEKRQEDADGQTVVDYSLHLNLRDPHPERLKEVPAVFERGVTSLKLFMAYDGYRLDDVAILRAMEQVAALNGLAVIHAENFDVIQELRRRLAAEGKTTPRWHIAASPSVTEGEAVHRALALAQLAGARTLIYHNSCREGVREIALAKARGQEVYGEACVQYLIYTDEVCADDSRLSRSLMVSPPLRGIEHQTALWQGLADGALDIVSTDHNPRQLTDGKQPAGSSSIETRLSLLHTFGVLKNRLTLNQWVKVCCSRPATVFGLQNKGQLLPGFDADIVLFDPRRELTLSPAHLHSAIDFCTYEGLTVRGLPTCTISRGEVIAQDGGYVGSAGRGRFVRRG